MDARDGYILRISKDEWLSQVYDLRKYYSGVMRHWDKGTVILLVKKAEEGDSFIGYGVVDKVEKTAEMSPEEKDYCLRNNWRCALSFDELKRFPRPFPIKRSLLAEDPRKGSYLHGVKLSWKVINHILEDADAYQSSSGT
ncbi:MAG: hypothetical protein ACLFVP_02125 [Candidatus Bathyarchaeia archaeon]